MKKKNMGSNGSVAMSYFSQNYASNSLTPKELLVWEGGKTLNVLVISKTQIVLRVGGKSKFPDVKLLKNHLIQIFLKQDFSGNT